MKTILVPTDFSETAKNASLYAIDFAKQVKAKKIILYNTYQAPVSVGPDPMVPVLEVFDLETVKKANEENLQLLKFKFLAFCGRRLIYYGIAHDRKLFRSWVGRVSASFWDKV